MGYRDSKQDFFSLISASSPAACRGTVWFRRFDDASTDSGFRKENVALEFSEWLDPRMPKRAPRRIINRPPALAWRLGHVQFPNFWSRRDSGLVGACFFCRGFESRRAR